ncbi:MAG: ATP/GTP-binding protein [Candidatus Bathyarchaeia archaeon]
MFGIFPIGTAGCGKSLLTGSLKSWLQQRGKSVAALNLDPGVLYLPYMADVDIRQHVDIKQIMDKYELGPNGALIAASDLAIERLDKVNSEIQDLASEYVIIDTPGQMELFAFRASGLAWFQGLDLDQKIILFLFDGPFCIQPVNYVSILYLAAAVYNRMVAPQLNVLTKMDLLTKKKLTEILKWSSEPESLRMSLRDERSSHTYLLSRDMFTSIARLQLDFSLIACSAKHLHNFVGLEAAIQRMFGYEDNV